MKIERSESGRQRGVSSDKKYKEGVGEKKTRACVRAKHTCLICKAESEGDLDRKRVFGWK
jgi:hypothetical protein